MNQSQLDIIDRMQIYSILLQFSDVTKDCRDCKSNARHLIHRNLLKYRKFPKENADIYTQICDKACYLLNPLEGSGNESPLDVDMHLEDLDGSKSDIPYQFQSKWLQNIDILLPPDKQIMSILPYLLTCYTANASRRHLDPFGGEITKAWQEIFPEYADDITKEQLAVGEGNRSRYIDDISSDFVILKGYSYKDLLENGQDDLDEWVDYETDSDIPENLLEANLDDSTELFEVNSDEENSKVSVLLPKARGNSKKSARAAGKRCMKSWELYRRFAAFCEACNDESAVNITLSMALFADIWFNSLHKKSPHKEKEDNTFLSSVFTELTQYSWEDVSQDCLRNQILRLLKKGTDLDDVQNVHVIAWLNRFNYKTMLK